MKFNLFFILFTFLAHRFLPKYDFRMQLLMFKIKMLRDRIDDQRIVPTPEERAELLRLGNEINHDVADVMPVVKPQTYRRWLSPKAKSLSPKPAGRPGTAEDIVALILRVATENLSWGYKRIFGELKKLGISVGLTTIRDILKRSNCPPPPAKTKSKPNLPWSKFVSAHMESLVACDSNGRSGSAASSPGTSGKRRKQRFLQCHISVPERHASHLLCHIDSVAVEVPVFFIQGDFVPLRFDNGLGLIAVAMPL